MNYSGMGVVSTNGHGKENLMLLEPPPEFSPILDSVPEEKEPEKKLLTLSFIQELIERQNSSKTNWEATGDAWTIIDMVREELDELQQAVDQDKPAVEVASELGDLFYLLLRFCSMCGITPEHAIMMKIWRNEIKHADPLNISGGYEAGKKLSKETWKAMGGDLRFYDMYEQYGEAYLNLFTITQHNRE